MPLGLFDPSLVPAGWFDVMMQNVGWFMRELLTMEGEPPPPPGLSPGMLLLGAGLVRVVDSGLCSRQGIMRRLLSWVLVLALLAPAPLWAAVAFDAASECTTNGATSLTCTHTSAGSERAGYCAITHENGSTDVSSVTATWNGTTMDIVFTDTATHASKHTRLFRLTGQSAGSQSVIFDWGGANRAFSAVCVSFTGVDSVDPDDAQVVVTNDLSGGTTDSVSSATGDMVLDILVTASSLNSAVDGGQGNTLINALFDSQTANGLGMSYEAGAASVAMGWTWTGFANFVHWQINLNAAAGGGATCNGGLMLQGVGGC